MREEWNWSQFIWNHLQLNSSGGIAVLYYKIELIPLSVRLNVFIESQRLYTKSRILFLSLLSGLVIKATGMNERTVFHGLKGLQRLNLKRVIKVGISWVQSEEVKIPFLLDLHSLGENGTLQGNFRLLKHNLSQKRDFTELYLPPGFNVSQY